MDTQTTMLRTLRYGQGYAGKRGCRPYCAKITGTDMRYGLTREFAESVSAVREHYNRSRTMIDITYELYLDGLYELSEEGERWIVMCYPDKTTGAPRVAKVSDERLRRWLAALDAGMSDRDARIASKEAQQ